MGVCVPYYFPSLEAKVLVVSPVLGIIVPSSFGLFFGDFGDVLSKNI